MGIATINPATGETVKTFTALTDAEIENALALADRAFRDYRRVSFDTRSQWMQNAANLLEENAETYAKIMTLEMGKPITAAIAEVKKSAAVCRFYAENAAQFLADVPAESDASNSFIAYEPLGAILAVCRTRINGRKCWFTQTRFQRTSMRLSHWGNFSKSWIS